MNILPTYCIVRMIRVKLTHAQARAAFSRKFSSAVSQVCYSENPSDDEAETLILDVTKQTRPEGLPEVTLRLITPECTLWTAGERELPCPLPYWAFAWPGGWGISRYLLDNPEVVQGKRVVDFASGSGMQGIAAALAGAAEVHAVEVDPFAVVATRINARDNGVSSQVRATQANIIGQPAYADVLIAGDVCYEEPLASEVLAWLRKVAGQGTTVLLGDPGRWGLPQHMISGPQGGHMGSQTQILDELSTYSLPRSLQDENFGFQQSHVWCVRP